MQPKDWTLQKTNDTPLERYLNYVRSEQARNRRWKIGFFGAVACLAVSCVCLFLDRNLPKEVPVVIALSEWGEPKYVGSVSKRNYDGIKVPERAFIWQVNKFVTNMYTISLDSKVTKKNLKDCYVSLTRTSAAKFTKWLKDENPLKDFGVVLQEVEIETTLALSNNSYQVDFLVTNTDKAGRINSKTRMRGVLSTQLMEPAEEDKELNLLGIYITNFDFTVIGSAR